MQLALENYNVETETKNGRVISDMLLDRFKLQVYVYVKESNALMFSSLKNYEVIQQYWDLNLKRKIYFLNSKTLYMDLKS